MVLTYETGDGARPLRRSVRFAARAALACGAAAVGVSFAFGAAAQPSKVSTAKERKEVSITVYNQNFGLVREVRGLDLAAGKQSLEVRDVAATIQPETVAMRSLGGDLRVLEQNYRYDLLTPATLLDKFVGKKIRIYRYDEKLGTEQGFDAEVLSVADGRPVLRMGGEITYDFPGRLAFPGVPANLIAKPTLVWLLDATQPKQDVEVTYLARNLNWSADYVMVVDDADAKADLTGWVTLSNQSGASYENAKLKLVAGDVNRVQNVNGAMDVTLSERDGDSSGFKEESLFEYHMYTLERPTDVLQNEQKQVTLLEARNIGVEKRLMFFGQQYWYRGQYGELQSNQKVGVYLDLQNSQKNGLGMPLPKGIVRVYKADSSGARQFVGEDAIDHTPRDEKIRIKMGEAFDVVGTRKQTDWTALGGCQSESAWEIQLRNHKDKAVDVEDWEPIGGDWKLIQQSHPSEKKDAFTFTFKVSVPANGKTVITYRARVRWC